MFIFCLHCLTGYEHHVVNHATRLGYPSLVPVSSRIVFKNGKRITQQRKLFPGYVFLQSESLNADEIGRLTDLDYVIRMLGYDTGQYALKEEDAGLISRLWQNNGVLEVSRVWREGNRIRIISGPLKDLEARILDVNLKRNSVAVLLGDGSILGKIWCSIEMIEKLE